MKRHHEGKILIIEYSRRSAGRGSRTRAPHREQNAASPSALKPH
jgi:hypothetical protein